MIEQDPNLPPRLAALAGEDLPQWDMSRTDTRYCITCGHSQYRIFCYRPDGLPVALCEKCDTMYLPVIPTWPQLDNYYQRYAERKAYMRGVTQPADLSFARAVEIHLIALAKGIPGVGGLLKKFSTCRSIPVSDTCEILIRTGGISGKRVLEVGPGTHGGILGDVRRFGGKGTALELDRNAAEAIRMLGFDAYASEAAISGEFDIIYAGMVLEHLPAPVSMIAWLYDLAAPGARILVRVPNAGQAMQIGSNWIGFRVDLEHLNYFDQKSLNTMLTRAGFSPECVWLSMQPMLPEYLPMADRRRFVDFAENLLGRNVLVSNDPFCSGEFMLTMLARK